MPLFRLRIYVKVFVIVQIFSKSFDIWLWNFAHLFTIMTVTCKQEEVTVSSIFLLSSTKNSRALLSYRQLLLSGLDAWFLCILPFQLKLFCLQEHEFSQYWMNYVNFVFKFKGTVLETELQEVSHKRGKIAIDRLDRKFDKAEVRFFFIYKAIFKKKFVCSNASDSQNLPLFKFFSWSG
jgi:hypothetical protein